MSGAAGMPMMSAVRATAIPVVTITAPDSVAAEDGPSSAVLVIHRSGALDGELTLAIEVSGTATEGADFERMPRSVTLRRGQASVALLVKPIDDRMVEGDERVTVSLKRAANYLITSPGEASVILLDNDRFSNIAPVAQLTSPANESKYVAPATVTLRANASDSDGSVRQVEFFAGDRSLGVDASSPYSVTWTNVPSGEYTVTARATDDAGVDVVSEPIRIFVSAATSITTGVFGAKINFQPAGTRVPEGYETDTGAVFGVRSNRLTYGWSGDNRENTRNRNSSLSPDQRYDTLAYMQPGGKNLHWEIVVPNGSYQVRVVAGDASSLDSVYGIDVEGIKAISGTPTTLRRWLEGTVTVKVNDGRLTVGNRAEARANKICFIEIQGEGSTNLPPKVLITSPRDGASAAAGTDVALVAEAADPDGSIKRVEFFLGDRLLAGDETSPYAFTLKNATGGTYTVTAKATDDRGATTTSAPVRFTVGAEVRPFRITLLSPLNGTVMVAPASVGLVAVATDSESLVKSVEFFTGEKSLGVATNNPLSLISLGVFRLTWTNPPAGTFTLIAKATDTLGRIALSSPVKLVIQSASSLAKLTLTSPADGATFTAPATLTLHATAVDPNGSISRVEFFAGTNRIGISELTFIRAPDRGEPILHAFEWRNVAAGEYRVTAMAKDSKGASVTSATIAILVKARALQSGPATGVSLGFAGGAIVTAVEHRPGGAVALECAGTAGQTYVVESTTDLSHWTTRGKVTAANATFRFTDPVEGDLGPRFYRVRKAIADE